MASILFFIKRKKLLNNGSAPIFVRVSSNHSNSECSIHRSVVPDQWITAKGRARGNTLPNKQLNSFIDQQEFKIREIEKELIDEGKEVSAKSIIARYRGIDENNVSFIGLYEEHNAKLHDLAGLIVARNTYKRHMTSLKLFREFLLSRYNLTDIPTKEVTVAVLDEYRHYLLAVRKTNNNTMVKYLRNLGKIINIAIARGVMKQNPIDALKLRIEEVDKEFLTKEELDRLMCKPIAIARLEQVRDVFVFCCMTGLAYVDVFSLTADDITTDGANRQWIRKTRIKTNNMCDIPLLRPAREILEKYSEVSAVSGKLLPVVSNQKMNAYLKEIAGICGINKELTTHTARHTFATTVTLANNVSIENVSKMLGHSTIRMTQHYAKILNSSIAREMDAVESFMQA